MLKIIHSVCAIVFIALSATLSYGCTRDGCLTPKPILSDLDENVVIHVLSAYNSVLQPLGGSFTGLRHVKAQVLQSHDWKKLKSNDIIEFSYWFDMRRLDGGGKKLGYLYEGESYGEIWLRPKGSDYELIMPSETDPTFQKQKLTWIEYLQFYAYQYSLFEYVKSTGF